MSRPFHSPARRRALFSSSLACLALGGAVAACSGQDDACKGALTSTLLTARLTQSSVVRVDLLLAVDNSRSMADKQQLLALAVPDLIGAFANPPCVDAATGLTTVTPNGPLDICPPGTHRKIQPISDIHVGVISSSLGGHGSDACDPSGAGKASNDDKAHLLDREDPTTAEKVATYQGLGFLAWDPKQQLDPPGEADLLTDSPADANPAALIPSIRDLVLGAGQIGCGYEAQLESWYRFLVDPTPPESITLDQNNSIVLNGIDKVLLDQRKAFLRPDSLVGIVMLTDENDCSIRESGQFYFAAQQKTPNGSPSHLPKARAICDTDPNNECCFSCGQKGPKDAAGDPVCAADPSCTLPNGQVAYLDETTDNINLRCYNQKRRFGIDFLYGTDRYQKALSSTTVTDRNGAVVANPLFTDLDLSDANSHVRNPGLVFLAGIVGVPWQDIARTDANGEPDLKSGLDTRGAPTGGFKSANELSEILPGKEYTTWDVILGRPEEYPVFVALPKDPLMVESIAPRTGTNPITGDSLAPPSQPLGNPINGNERTIFQNDDLQYACIFPLVKVDPKTGNLTPDVRDCSVIGQGGPCECQDKANDSPLCQLAASGFPTDQVRAKAYPGLRELQVLRDIGGQGIVSSVCPAQVDAPGDADFGYRRALDALTERLIPAVSGSCLQPTLSADTDGRVQCVIVEAQQVGAANAATCNACAEAGRATVSADHASVVDDIGQEAGSAAFNCFCEIPQLTGGAAGEALWTCQNDPSESPVQANGAPVDGYCYVDADKSLGDPEIVAKCPESEKRLIRFVGAGAAKPGSTLYIACVDEHTHAPNPACEDGK